MAVLRPGRSATCAGVTRVRSQSGGGGDVGLDELGARGNRHVTSGGLSGLHSTEYLTGDDLGATDVDLWIDGRNVSNVDSDRTRPQSARDSLEKEQLNAKMRTHLGGACGERVERSRTSKTSATPEPVLRALWSERT